MTRTWISVVFCCVFAVALVWYSVSDDPAGPTATALPQQESQLADEEEVSPIQEMPQVERRTQSDALQLEPAPPWVIEEGMTLVTVVEDATGEPLGGVEVLWLEAYFSLEVDVEGGPDLSLGVEAVLREHGTILITDAEGRVGIRSEYGFGHLGISTPSYFNYSLYELEDEMVLRARAPVTVPCLTLDAQGRPIPGKSLQLRVTDGEREEVIQEIRSDPDGHCRFLVFDRVRDLEGHGISATLLAGPRILSGVRQVQPVSMLEAPPRPLEFRFREVGSILVRLIDGNGDLIQEPHELVAYPVHSSVQGQLSSWSPSKEETHMAHPLTVEDGEALFEEVDLGQSFVVRVYHDDDLKTEAFLTGPMTAGQVAEVDLLPSGTAPSFHGRILNESGKAAPGIAFRYTLRDRRKDGRVVARGKLPTDKSGRFLLEPTAEIHATDELTLAVTLKATAKHPVRGFLVDLDGKLGSGSHDLGDLVIKAPPLLAGGFVRSPEGQPIHHADVYLAEGRPAGYREGLDWARDYQARTRTDAQGRFALHAFSHADALSLEMEAKGFVDTRVEFTPPAPSLDVEMERGWTLSGRFLLDETVRPDRLAARVEAQDPGRELPRNYHYMESGYAFEFTEAFAPGEYRLLLDDLSGVEVPFTLGKEGGHHDFGDLDFRGQIEVYRIHVKTESGDLPSFLHAQDLEGNWIGREGEERGVIILYMQEPVTPLFIIGKGMSPTRIDALQDGMEVMLQEGLPVTLGLDQNPELPEGWSISLDVRSSTEGMPIAGDLVFLGFPFYGETKLPQPGSYQAYMSFVNLEESGTAGSAVMVRVSSQETLLSFVVEDTMAPQSITIRLPEGYCEEALAELARDYR